MTINLDLANWKLVFVKFLSSSWKSYLDTINLGFFQP
jgi:hypothetical protein